jgi:septal ring factor EnvC (AmiA/AmiB activator)
MADQWPPNAPGVNKAFKRAHNATNDNVAKPPSLPIVTKKEIEALEAQLSRSKPQLNLTPVGMKQSTTADRELEKRIAKMKKRLEKPKGKAREDFERSV